ncbi:hypothetical protein WY02_16315 [Pseudonocardia sp. AL041005-10]|nr:hypothetical protein WY02_16315 [Pseudonocardia sp. AL041005-10]
MPPSPRTSSAADTDGRGSRKASMARPSGVIRTRCGWSQPSTRPCWWASVAAADRVSTALAARCARTGPSATVSASERPGTHSATAAPSTSAGRPCVPGASTSSNRALPECSKQPERRARTIISPARAVPSGSSERSSAGSLRSSVTPTGRRSTVSSARQNSAPAAGSDPIR